MYKREHLNSLSYLLIEILLIRDEVDWMLNLLETETFTSYFTGPELNLIRVKLFVYSLNDGLYENNIFKFNKIYYR